MKIALCMSLERKEAKNKIKHTALGKMPLHIGYLCLYPNTVDEDKWLAELISPILKLRQLTNIKGGTFDKKVLFKWLWTEPFTPERASFMLRDTCIAHLEDKIPTGDWSDMPKIYHRLVKLMLDDGVITKSVIKTLFTTN